MRRDAFYSVHPAVSFAFFLAVILMTAIVIHPVITGISLMLSCACHVCLKGRKGISFCLFVVLPLIIFVAILNPLFNHAGVTVLFYLKNGNAVTLEAVYYGVNSACMFAALLLWCSCLNSVMSSDKYTYLFGGVIPVLSLVFSMVLRFVPRFLNRIRAVSDAQSSVSEGVGKKPVKAVRQGLSVISVTVTWALESAVTAADSMKSRGYGLPGRTSFSMYRFGRRDAAVGSILVLSSVLFIASAASKSVWFRFYPSIKYASFGAFGALGCAAFLVLCALPLILNIKERLSWQASLSRI